MMIMTDYSMIMFKYDNNECYTSHTYEQILITPKICTKHRHIIEEAMAYKRLRDSSYDYTQLINIAKGKLKDFGYTVVEVNNCDFDLNG